MHAPVDNLVEKLRQLPPDRLAEVEDFIDFLNQRYRQTPATVAAMVATQPVLESIWDNEADAVYDEA